MSLFYNDSAWVLRPPMKTNRALESALDYAVLRTAVLAAAAAELPIGVERTQVHIRPTSQTEVIGEDRAVAISDFRLATAPGSGDWDLLATDWVRLPDGSVCSVVGPPARPSDPQGGNLHHVEVLLRKVAV